MSNKDDQPVPQFTLEQLRYLHQTYPNDVTACVSNEDLWRAKGRREVVDNLIHNNNAEVTTNVQQHDN